MLKFPEHLDIESGTICNMMICPMCPFGQMKRKKGLMSYDFLKKIMREVKEKGVKTSYLHMIGESLCQPDIFKMINLVHKTGIRTSISTNCILLKERKEEIFNSCLDELTICLDGINKETYGKYRDKKYFDQVFYNIMDFLTDWSVRKNKIHLQLQLIRMGQNTKDIRKIRDVFEKFQSRGSFEFLFKGYSTFAGRVPDLGEGKTPPRREHCQKPWREFTISWDGLALGCCRNFDNFIILGDCNKQSIQEIWNSKAYNNFRNSFRQRKYNELCKNC